MYLVGRIRCDGNKAYKSIVGYSEKRKVQKGVFDFQISDGLTFLQNDTTKYDIVLFCNYLHFFDIPEIKMHIQYAMERLNNNGLIGIVALCKFYDDHIEEDGYKTSFDNKRVQEIFREYKTVFSEETDMHVYLGVQKGA